MLDELKPGDQIVYYWRPYPRMHTGTFLRLHSNQSGELFLVVRSHRRRLPITIPARQFARVLHNRFTFVSLIRPPFGPAGRSRTRATEAAEAKS